MLKRKQGSASLKYSVCAVVPWTVILRKMKNVRYFSHPDYFTLVTYMFTHTHIHTHVFIYVCVIASPKAVWCHMPLSWFQLG